MNTYEVVLAYGNHERHYYPETSLRGEAVDEAKAEWAREFGGDSPKPTLISITKKPY